VASSDLAEILVQGLTCDEVHRQVPVLGIGEVVIDARKVGVCQAREQAHFAIEGVGRLNHVARMETFQVDLLDRDQCVMALHQFADNQGGTHRLRTVC